MIHRFFSTESRRRLFSEILKENSGTILAVGVIGSGSFGIGLYVNQMRVYEEKINAVKMEAKKDIQIAEEKIKASEVKIKAAKLEAQNEALDRLYHIFTQEEFKEAKKKILDLSDEVK